MPHSHDSLHHLAHDFDRTLEVEALICIEKLQKWGFVASGVTVNMLDCTAAETALQDARLNSGYKAANQVLSSENKASLLTAQCLWLKYREANCGLYGRLTGGTIDSLNGTSCFLEMTKARADDLAWLAKQ